MGDRRSHHHGGDSSSGEEDGDAKWRAAIDSVTVSSVFISSLTNGVPATSINTTSKFDDDFELNLRAQPPKPYQIKVGSIIFPFPIINRLCIVLLFFFFTYFVLHFAALLS